MPHSTENAHKALLYVLPARFRLCNSVCVSNEDPLLYHALRHFALLTLTMMEVAQADQKHQMALSLIPSVIAEAAKASKVKGLSVRLPSCSLYF